MRTRTYGGVGAAVRDGRGYPIRLVHGWLFTLQPQNPPMSIAIGK